MTPVQEFLVLGCAAIAIVAAIAAIAWRVRRTPAQKERRRRKSLYELGRMGDGLLTDVKENTVYYSYSVNGVDYNTSQDVAELRNMVPADESLIIGPVTLKYLARNPGNSIVVCEEWSGLRIRSRAAQAR